MARICHSCGKRPAFGQSRSHSMVATKRRFDANLQKVRISEAGAPKRVYVCTRCLKAGKVTKALAAAAALADPSLVRFRTVVQRALAELEARREEVNDLNVFPVADGDTGDNMALTLRAVLDELDRLSGRRARIDEIGRDEIVDSVARAALLGARGNSGVILSQLIRGAAEELVSPARRARRPGAHRRGDGGAAERAYGSVREPAEGTILMLARHGAGRAATPA